MRLIEKLMEIAGALLMATICVVVFIGVVYRYLLNSPIGWIEEVARYALVWVTYIGSFLALRRSRHLSIDILAKRLSPKAQKVLNVTAMLVVLPFCYVLIVFGFYYARVFMDQGTPYLDIPLGYIYFILPFIGVLLTYELVVRMFHVLKGE